MVNEEDVILERLEMLSKRDKIAKDRMLELRKFDDMPFWQRIQQKGFESTLQRVYDTQKCTFEKICRKEKIHKTDWKDEFCLFWAGYIKGTFISINQYLKRKNFS